MSDPERRSRGASALSTRRWNPRRWGQTFEALQNPGYARYIWGSFFFFFAMQMQMLLRGYLIYDLTNDPFALGLISLCFAVPMLVLAPFAGVVADRFDRQRVVAISQSIGMLLTGVTTVLILADAIAYWHLLVITFFSASAMTFNMPARQAIVPSLVTPDKLMNALALNSAVVNASRIVAPALAGLLVAPIGVGGAYIITLVFNVLAVVLFLKIRLLTTQAPLERRGYFGNIVEGFAYVKSNRLLLMLLLTSTVPLLLAMPHQNLLPVFAKSVWHVGATGLGLLQTMAGVGGLIGAGIAANLSSVRQRALVMSGAFVLFGVFITMFALSPTIGPALVLVLFGDLASMVGQTMNNTVIQSTIPDAVRGRVMSLMMMTFGITPFGTLPAGWIARQYGVRWAVGGGGAILVVISLAIYFASRTYRSLNEGLPSLNDTTIRPVKRALPVGSGGD